jgi:hypothetical protein
MRSKRSEYPNRFKLFQKLAYSLRLKSHPLLASFFRIKIPAPIRHLKKLVITRHEPTITQATSTAPRSTIGRD